MDHALTVMLPTHGRAPLLRRTLDSLATCRLPGSYAETVVVENGPPAGAEALVREVAAAHPALRLRYLHVERANKSHALNEALGTVEPGLVVFFDDDIRMVPGILTAYTEAAAEYEPGEVFFGGPFDIDYEGDPPPDWLRPLLPWSARGLDLENGPKAPFYLGFNWAAFTEDIRAQGGFDPNFGPGSPIGAGGQETTMQRQMGDQGFKGVDVLGAKVWHWVPRERCTAEWALDRARSVGLTRGILSRQQGKRRFILQQIKRLTLALPAIVSASLRRGTPEWYEMAIPLSIPFAIVRGYLFPPRAVRRIERPNSRQEVP